MTDDEADENIEYKSQNTKTNNKHKTKKQKYNQFKKQANAEVGQRNKQAQGKREKEELLKVIKWLTLIGIIIAGIVYAMLSPIFNIKEH